MFGGICPEGVSVVAPASETVLAVVPKRRHQCRAAPVLRLFFRVVRLRLWEALIAGSERIALGEKAWRHVESRHAACLYGTSPFPRANMTQARLFHCRTRRNGVADWIICHSGVCSVTVTRTSKISYNRRTLRHTRPPTCCAAAAADRRAFLF